MQKAPNILAEAFFLGVDSVCAGRLGEIHQLLPGTETLHVAAEPAKNGIVMQVSVTLPIRSLVAELVSTGDSQKDAIGKAASENHNLAELVAASISSGELFPDCTEVTGARCSRPLIGPPHTDWSLPNN